MENFIDMNVLTLGMSQLSKSDGNMESVGQGVERQQTDVLKCRLSSRVDSSFEKRATGNEKQNTI